MRRRAFTAGVVFFGFGLGVPAPAHAQSFEGAIKARSISVPVEALPEQTVGTPQKIFAIPIDEILATGEAEVHQFTHYLKGSKFRTQPMGQSENDPYVIIDYQRGVFQTVQPAEKTYVEWTAEDLEKMRNQMGGMMPSAGHQPAVAPSSKPTVRPLGKTRVVNGVRCVGYEVRNGDDLTWAWVNDGQKDLMQTFKQFLDQMERMNPMPVKEELEESDLIVQYGLPMLTQQIDLAEGEAEGEYEIEEIVSIDHQSIPDSMFEPPAEYQKMSMADMMGGMMQQMQQNPELQEQLKKMQEKMKQKP